MRHGSILRTILRTILAAAVALTFDFSAAPLRLSDVSARAEGISAEARRKAYEDEMLARARAEAEERRREMAKARAEEERIAAEELAREEEARRLSERLKVASEARKAAEAAKRKQEADHAEAQRKAEAERIAETRRRAEEAARIAEAQRRAAEEARIAEARHRAEEAARIAEAQRRAAEEARIAEAQLRAEEAARVAEARRLAEEGARIAEAQRKADDDEVAAKRRTDAEVLAAVPAPPAGATDRQFTILIVLEAGHRGIRRHNPTGDPILCANGGCFVSAGADSPAEFLPARKALGLGATLGRRAGACRDQLGCVFRTVELGALPVHVQPVDMRLVRHDRRAAQEIVRDSHCRLDHGTIDCARPYVGPDYIMWVVPEWMAEHVGAAGLEAAVTRGLITRGGAAVAGAPMPWTR